ncbi:U6 small nuclear RNA (adenine-(43)-N(6))-methyltransferase [Culicoides brevitarsis]|uniref:U6 small nuclear RNA (adenine-(43)-N(6))-methyltransferase n=1 Tax=Culicoides brevitarsis TaxID=469753 RepID=UPI00307B91FA
MSLNRYMHPRNIYRKPPDFTELASTYKEFEEISTLSLTGRRKIDFKDQKALRVLTQCLLHKDFNLVVNIPEGKLIPTLPLRLNYVLWIEDILKTFNFSSEIRGFDVGCGASCIYGLLSAKKNGWKMFCTEVNEESLKFAQENVARNHLEEKIQVISQPDSNEDLFKAIFGISEEIHFTMCNPPFYDDSDDAMANRTGSRDMPRSVNTGSSNEISVEGSEVSFVKRMIDESFALKDRVKVFTSMLGKKTSLGSVKNYLKEKGVTNFITTEFCQGRTTRWGIAWSHISGLYLNKVPQFERKNMKKSTGHLVKFVFPEENSDFSLENLEKCLEKLFQDLKMTILLHEKEESESIWEISADFNTWSHQRRKRRRQETDDDEPPKKIGPSEPQKEPFLVFSACLKQLSSSFQLEMGFLEGTAGKDSVNQVLQYVKNNFKKYF